MATVTEGERPEHQPRAACLNVRNALVPQAATWETKLMRFPEQPPVFVDRSGTEFETWKSGKGRGATAAV